jgi:hypothetical protein
MPDGNNRIDMPMQTRLAPIGTINKETRTVSLVWSTGARVKRREYIGWDGEHRDYWEELSLDPAHVRMGRLTNGAPLLNTHNRWNLESVIGVVESASLRAGEGLAEVRFSAREDVEPIFQDVSNKIIRNVSAGYVTHKIEKLPPDERSEGLPIHRAIDWEPMELSLVPIGADGGAGVRAEQQQRMYPCEIIDVQPAVSAIHEERQMPNASQPAQAAATTAAATATAAPAAVATTETPEAIRAAAATAERARVADIMARCDQHGMPVEFRNALISEGASLEVAGQRILDELAKRQQKQTGSIAGVNFGESARVTGDELLQRRAAMSGAIFHRIAPHTKLEDNARPYRHMSMLRMAEEVLGGEGVSVRGMSRLDLATRAMLSTSDFANILADVANKRLRAAYEENVPTYTRWARRAANAPDFKNINVTAMSAAPSLLNVVEGGEFQYGSLTDGKETYAIATYGRIIPITRQAIINDDLMAFDRIPRLFGNSSRRLENYTVYQILLANAALADTVALFHGTHGNLPTAAAISNTSLGLARALMRKQTGMAGEKLNIAPKYLLCGADKEQEAYQYTSANYVPATSANINEFRAGGRTALEPIVDNEISGNKWFLAADNNQIDTVEYCYLDGSEGVYLESQIGFKIDGIEVKARLDFAAKAIDYRGLVYNSGA